MSFWGSLATEICGGVATAIVLGVVAAYVAASQSIMRHDEQLGELFEDNRRWFRDRSRQLAVADQSAMTELSARGLAQSGAWVQGMAKRRHHALHDYRDEISAKLRRYRAIRASEGWTHARVRQLKRRPWPAFMLTDAERETLDAWRADQSASHTADIALAVEDPTAEVLEPAIREFERNGYGFT